MGWLSSHIGRKAAQLTYDQVAGLIDNHGGGMVAGNAVTEKTALQVATVLSCVKTIADGCATPKLHVYREKPDGTRERALNIPEYRLLSRRPNAWQTSYEWRRQMTLHAALTGAGLSIKSRGGNGRTRELLPVMPGNWDVRRASRFSLLYRCWDEFGVIGEFAPDDVFILNGLQWDWARSLNAVRLAASAVGLAMASEKSHSKIHENGVTTSGVYSVEGSLTSEQHERLQAHIDKHYAGMKNAGKPMVLDMSAKWVSAQMNGADSQHVELRRLQIEEVCRAYSVFPIMVGHSDKSSTFASSEAFFAAHVKHTLAPWHTAWSQRMDEMLLDGSGPLYAEFDTRYLLAGSMSDRSTWARTMAEMGIYTRNELRDEEGKDPLDGLDKPLTPMNMGGKQPQGDAADPAVSKSFEAIEKRLDAMAARQAPAPQTVIELSTQRVEKALDSALQTMADTHAAKIKAFANELPITINVPTQPVPDVNVHLPAPNVVFEATVPPATVVMNGPKSSTQKVERDKDGEILQTTTTFVYPT